MTTEPIEYPKPGLVADTLEDRVIPIFEETARVEKRVVESGRAKVDISVLEHDEAIQTLLMRQDLVIDRVAMDHPVSEAPPVRRDGDTIIVPILEERVVVVKQLFLKEELHIRVGQTEHLDTQTVTLRREHATIEQT